MRVQVCVCVHVCVLCKSSIHMHIHSCIDDDRLLYFSRVHIFFDAKEIIHHGLELKNIERKHGHMEHECIRTWVYGKCMEHECMEHEYIGT